MTAAYIVFFVAVIIAGSYLGLIHQWLKDESMGTAAESNLRPQRAQKTNNEPAAGSLRQAHA